MAMYLEFAFGIALQLAHLLQFRDVRFELLSVKKIWDNAPHNAFTDLIRFNGRWYCAFREGKAHVSDDGKLRLIVSDDGEDWRSVSLFECPDGDLRDPKLSITADGMLMLNSAVRFTAPLDGSKYRQFKWALSVDGSPWEEFSRNFSAMKGLTHQSLTWLSKDGEEFLGPYACVSGAGTWRWSVTWHGGFGYSVGYGGKDASGCLYRTSDGKRWEIVASNIFPDGKGNEASLVFTDDGTLYCLLRDGGRSGNAHIGVANPPYTNWLWKDLGMRIGGPKLFRLPSGLFICGVRLYEGRIRTSLCVIDVYEGKMSELLTLPSGGDTSYTGILWHDDVLWVSYYSSHEGKSAIYLAKVRASLR
jgi:hypothetical protein